ncbi:hypothetical protein [Xanthomonas sp. MLO165]|nr:hypothetical protein [Xanthomonas sp. MLO165]
MHLLDIVDEWFDLQPGQSKLSGLVVLDHEFHLAQRVVSHAPFVAQRVVD